MSPLMNVVLNLPTATEFQSIADRLARLHDLEQQPIRKEQLVTGPVVTPWQPTNDRCRQGGPIGWGLDCPTAARCSAVAVTMSICRGCNKTFTPSGHGLFPTCGVCIWEGSVCRPLAK